MIPNSGTMESEGILVRCLQARRLAFEHENANLSPEQREDKWSQLWNDITSKVNPNKPSILPQKRSLHTAQLDLDSGSQRIPPYLGGSAVPHLERQISAPAGTTSMRKTASSSSANINSQTRPINIAQTQKRNANRRVSTSCASFPRLSLYTQPLTLINEHYQFRPPHEHLAQNPNSNLTAPAIPLGRSLASERGEYPVSFMSQLTVPNHPSIGSHSPYTATSDPGMTPASTVISEPMSRVNTNEQISERFDMFGFDSDVNASIESFPNMPVVRSNFPISTFPISSSVSMKPSLSQVSSESVSSSSSYSSSSDVEGVVAQTLSIRNRPLAPKQQNDSTNTQRKILNFRTEDGTLKQKAEIPRMARQPPQRKTTFCDYCNEHPNGFHGDHELRRHIERHHTQIRKVWICRDPDEDSTFLANCKACRNQKTYGANYNAAAHLRRTHFNPCKNKRGGRGKKSEGRGGKGGGNSPPMEELKAWMFESYEININGTKFIQEISPDTNTADIDFEQLAAMARDNATELDFDIDLEQVTMPMHQQQLQEYGNFAPITHHAPMQNPQAYSSAILQYPQSQYPAVSYQNFMQMQPYDGHPVYFS